MTNTRVAMFAVAFLLGILGVWILVAESLRPGVIELTNDPVSAASNYAKRGAAVTAARAGLLRGDLWADAAIASTPMPWTQDKSLAPPEEAQAITVTAIRYAPHDSRLWLLLAANYFRLNGLNEKALAALKMSYYTGSNTISILPERLFLVINSRGLEDKELRELVRHDILIAVMHKSALMPALADAYRSAPPSGKQFVEDTLAEFDPSVLAVIR